MDGRDPRACRGVSVVSSPEVDVSSRSATSPQNLAAAVLSTASGDPSGSGNDCVIVMAGDGPQIVAMLEVLTRPLLRTQPRLSDLSSTARPFGSCQRGQRP
jgi:hypothetical protein